MSAIADVRKSVLPLIGNPELSLIGRTLALKPTRHILRAVDIDRCSDKYQLKPRWVVTFLFEPQESLLLTWSGDLENPLGGPWDIRDPATAEKLCGQIETVALPILRKIETVEDFAAFATSERFPYTHLGTRPLRHVIVAAGLGRWEEALSILRDLETKAHDWSSWTAVHEDYTRVIRVLRPLIVVRDRVGIGKLLREWEAWSVRKMKLESIWEPTPFPVETAE